MEKTDRDSVMPRLFNREKQLIPGNYRFTDMKWDSKYIVSTVFHSENEAQVSDKSIRKKIKSFLHRKHSLLTNPVSLSTAVGKGKITDCGYDQFECIYTEIPTDCDLAFSADIIVHSFLEPGHITYQEGFGLFLRDTMDLDPETGYPYSNMIAVGGYYGGWNVFGRSGITGNSIENVENHFLYGKEDCSDAFQVFPSSPQPLHLLIERKGSGIRADITDESGRHLLRSNDSRTPGTDGFSFADDGSWLLPVSDNLFSERDFESLYLGFFAAGSSISIDTDSVELTLSKRSCYSGVKRQIFVSPEGSCMGFGTEEAPYDLQTAVMLCQDGQEICVSSGIYRLNEDLIIAKKHSGRKGCPKKLKVQENGQAVLDFGGSSHALQVLGDFWILEGLKVMHGFGIKVQGNHNHILNCTSEQNLETGILIRRDRNDSPREEWPSYNTVENCVSCFNSDKAGCNADGFACKITAGEGNRFIRCISYMNADDGFDLFTKNRRIGAVELIECRSFLNGYDQVMESSLHSSNGNGNGFKLGGSGLGVCHNVVRCEAFGNKADGFTSNSNPQMNLCGCRSGNNKGANYSFYFSGRNSIVKKIINDCTEEDMPGFDPLALWQKFIENEE